MLRVEEVSAAYGGIAALRRVTLEANAGEVVTIVGANGAGKSTLLRAIAGFIAPTEGSISLEGDRLHGLTPKRAVELGVALVPEGRQIWNALTVDDHLRLGAFVKRVDRTAYAQRKEEVQELFPALRERSGQRAGTLSGGEQQMLAVARALMSNPRLLLLDEPTLGLAPVVIERIHELLVTLRDQDVTMLLAEQNSELALDIADRGYLVETGKVVSEGTVDELRRSPQLLGAYLGVAELQDESLAAGERKS